MRIIKIDWSHAKMKMKVVAVDSPAQQCFFTILLCITFARTQIKSSYSISYTGNCFTNEPIQTLLPIKKANTKIEIKILEQFTPSGTNKWSIRF